MAKTLNQIQDLVRWEARDEQIRLSDTSELAMVNMIYRSLVSLIGFPEFLVEDTSLTTEVDQEAYTWPSIKMMDVTMIEVQDAEDDYKYKMVAPVHSSLEFSIERKKPSAFPMIFRRSSSSGVQQLLFAPKPKLGSQVIRITGIQEPTEMDEIGDATEFLLDSVDDAFALLISSDIAYKRSAFDRGNGLIQKASQILSGISGRVVSPDELREKVVNG